MKFWEALKEMEAGAVCAPDDSPYMHYSFRSGEFGFKFRTEPWEESLNSIGQHMDTGWRIVTPAPVEAQPAPSEAKPESLSDRVEAVEKFCAANADSHQGVLERVEQVERDIRDISTDARCRIKECSEHDKRLSALEAKLAALEAKESPVDHAFEVFAWPKGSLQWAEVEARQRGLSRIRRKSLPKHWRGVSIIGYVSQTEAGRHALDWEPCE